MVEQQSKACEVLEIGKRQVLLQILHNVLEVININQATNGVFF